MSLRRIRKNQIHSPTLKIENDKGGNDFSAFSPAGILQGDFWTCTVDSVEIAGLMLYKGNTVRAAIDSPGVLSLVNVNAGNWGVSRFSNGQTLVMKCEFFVDSEVNYDFTSKHLTVSDFSATPFNGVDNVNVYVNSAKYTLQHFTYQTGSNVIVWIPINSGFDLATGDFIEVEVFSQLKR
jgi:hypothetical protein